MHANRQRLLNQRSTARALLGCVAWINRYDTTTSVLGFLRGVRDQFVPGCIRDALSQTMILKHVPDIQVFKRDHAETVDQFTTYFMSKVFAPVGNALMDMLNGLAPLGSFGRSFFSPREQALHLRQFFLIMTKEAGIFNLHPIGERGKTFKSYVHPDCQAIVGQGSESTPQAKQAYQLPTASLCTVSVLTLPWMGRCRTIFTAPILEMSRPLPAGSNSKPDCLKGKLAYRPYPRARVARLFTCLHSTKESLESQIHSLLNILQDLGMETHQFGMISVSKW